MPLSVVIARQKTAAADKAACLAALASVARPDERQSLLLEALDATRRIWEDYRRIIPLVKIVAQSEGENRALLYREACETFSKLSSASQAHTLEQTASFWPEGHVRTLATQAIQAARQNNNLWERAWVLESLAEWQEEADKVKLLTEALNSARGHNDWVEVTARAKLAVRRAAPSPGRGIGMRQTD